MICTVVCIAWILSQAGCRQTDSTTIEPTQIPTANVAADSEPESSETQKETMQTVSQKEELLPADAIPAYIKEEAGEVAQKVRNVLKDDSIVFLAMSDTHYPGSEDGAWNQEQNNEGGLHTAMAAKTLSDMLPFDFVAHLGDVGNGEKTTTPDEMKAQIQEFVTYFTEAAGNIPRFIAIGNHDPGIYYHDAQTDGEIHTLSGDWLYENFTAHSASDATVFGGEENGGYCYRDFADQKLRVFLLNSAEQLITAQTDKGPLPAQQLWVANALKDLGSKTDAEEWSFLVLCHYPLDYGDARPISNVFEAYVNGASITVDGSTVSFEGCNAPRFLAQFHGHTHCFKFARLNGYGNTKTMTEYDAWRIAIPNVQYSRENYYTKSFYGIYFNEEKSYEKTPDTAEETSLVVNVINPSEEMLYSFCYGAGYDRAVNLSGVSYYSIHTAASGADITGDSTVVRDGDPYTAAVTLIDGYDLESVVITMGDQDISDRYENGKIHIPAVTADVVIAVNTKATSANLIPQSLGLDNDLYKGDHGEVGYNSGYRISSSYGTQEELDGGYVTGFIPVNPATETLVLRNIGTEIVNYNEAKLVGYASIAESGTQHGQLVLTDIVPNADGSLTITPESGWSADMTAVKYVRLSCSYIGSDSVICTE